MLFERGERLVELDLRLKILYAEFESIQFSSLYSRPPSPEGSSSPRSDTLFLRNAFPFSIEDRDLTTSKFPLTEDLLPPLTA